MYKKSIIAGLMAVASFAMVGCGGGGSDSGSSDVGTDPIAPAISSGMAKEWNVSESYTEALCKTEGLQCKYSKHEGYYVSVTDRNERNGNLTTVTFDPMNQDSGVRIYYFQVLPMTSNYASQVRLQNEVDTANITPVYRNQVSGTIHVDFGMTYNFSHFMSLTQETMTMTEVGGDVLGVCNVYTDGLCSEWEEKTVQHPFEISISASAAVAIGNLGMEVINNN